jgi:hypothetical protein
MCNFTLLYEGPRVYAIIEKEKNENIHVCSNLDYRMYISKNSLN